MPFQGLAGQASMPFWQTFRTVHLRCSPGPSWFTKVPQGLTLLVASSSQGMLAWVPPCGGTCAAHSGVLRHALSYVIVRYRGAMRQPGVKAEKRDNGNIAGLQVSRDGCRG